MDALSIRPPINNIYTVRRYHDMKQSDCVKIINNILGSNYTQKTFSNWEVSNTNIPNSVQIALCLMFQCSMEYLFCMTSDSSMPQLTPRFSDMIKAIRADMAGQAEAE